MLRISINISRMSINISRISNNISRNVKRMPGHDRLLSSIRRLLRQAQGLLGSGKIDGAPRHSNGGLRFVEQTPFQAFQPSGGFTPTPGRHWMRKYTVNVCMRPTAFAIGGTGHSRNTRAPGWKGCKPRDKALTDAITKELADAPPCKRLRRH